MNSDDRSPGDSAFGEPTAADPIREAYVSPPIRSNDVGPPIRPLGITVIMVLGLLFGILGMFNAAMAAVGLMFGEYIQAMVNAQGNETQMQMQAELQEVGRRFLIPNVLLLLCAAAVSSALAVGGIGLMMTKPWSRTLLRRTFLAAIVLEIARGGFGLAMQIQNVPIMKKYLDEAEQGGPGLAQMTSFFMWVGLAFWLIWAVIKIGMLIWGRAYLAGRSAESYFAATGRS